MSQPTVHHIKDWTGSPDEVYCGRPGKGHKDAIFGNPVAVGRTCNYCSKFHAGAGDTLPCYEKYLDGRLDTDGQFRKAVRDLDNKKLFCFCVSVARPEGPCHCFILADRSGKLNQAKTVVRRNTDGANTK